MQTVKKALFGLECRGDPWSPAEKRSFSDFPKGNNLFRLAATDFALQNPRAIDDRPYGYFFDSLPMPFDHRPTPEGVGWLEN